MRNSKHKKHFSAISLTYDKAASLSSNSSLEKLVQKLLSEYQDIDVLDIGTGTGNFGKIFLNNGCRVWGVDHNLNMLHLAEKKGIVPIHLDIAELSVIQKKFDLLAARQVFQYVGEEVVQGIIRQFGNLLKPEGKVVVHHMTGPNKTACIDLKKCMVTPGNSNPFLTHEEQLNLMMSARFSLEEDSLSEVRVKESYNKFAMYRGISKEDAINRFRELSKNKIFDVNLLEEEVEYSRYYSLIKVRQCV